MNCFETQKADSNTVTSGINSENKNINFNGTCMKPQEFDKLCNYSSNKPFANLPGPPSDSKIKTYWKNGSVKAPLKTALTFTQYISWLTIPVGSKMIKKNGNIPSGDGYTGKGNGLNNPINISYSKLSQQYGGNSAKKMADGQRAAIFPNMLNGLAAGMHYFIINYHGKNTCQLNNQQQGYVSLDGKEVHDCIGMAALRLRWVTNNCKKTGLKPYEQLNLKDKETLFNFINSASSIESGLTFQRGFLERAYNKLPSNLKG
jgi:hypothetical protein